MPLPPFEQSSQRSQIHVGRASRSEEHTSELQSPCNLVCRLLLEKKKIASCHVSNDFVARNKKNRHAKSVNYRCHCYEALSDRYSIANFDDASTGILYAFTHVTTN